MRAAFDLSFDFTQASKPNQKDAQQHIVFFSDGENPSLFELEEKYSHHPGIFNYVKKLVMFLMIHFCCVGTLFTLVCC